MTIKKMILFFLLVIIPAYFAVITAGFALIICLKKIGLSPFEIAAIGLVFCFCLLVSFVISFLKNPMTILGMILLNFVVIFEFSKDMAEIIQQPTLLVGQLLVVLIFVEVFCMLFYAIVVDKRNLLPETRS